MPAPLVAIAVLAIGLALIVVTGLAAAVLLADKRDREESWIFAPFLGLAVAELVLGNFAYHGVPIGWSAWPLAAAVVIAGGLAIRRGVPRPPKGLIPVVALVIMLTGFGYLMLGPHYVAYHWVDQLTNVLTAQFLMDWPLHTTVADVGNTPYLLIPIANESFRIGAQITIADVATIAGTNAKTAYGAVAVLASILASLALWAGAERLGLSGWRRGMTAVFGASLPGLVSIQLECFLPQALATSFLLFWPVTLDRALTTPTWRTMLTAALVMIAPLYIYPEFFPLFIAVAVMSAVWHAIATRRVLGVLAIALAAGLALASNSPATHVAWQHWSGATTENVLSIIYPFAFSLEGLRRVWSGELLVRASPFVQYTGDVLAVVLTMVGVAGLGWVAWRRRATPYAAAVIAIMLLPLVPLAVSLRTPVPYQFYKILLSTSALWALGLAVLLADPVGRGRRTRGVLLLAICVLTTTATIYLVRKTIVGGDRTLIDRATMATTNAFYDRLERLAARDVVFLPAEGPRPDDQMYRVHVAYVAYHARRSRLWMLDHHFTDKYVTAPYPRGAVPALMPADVEGNGRADAVLFNAEGGHWLVGQGRPPSLAPVTPWIGGFGFRPYDAEIARLADVDGDLRSDAVVFNPRAGDWWVARSNGHAFFGARAWIRGFGTSYADGEWPLLGDVDGDKRADAVIFNPRSGDWWVGRSDGRGFAPPSRWLAGDGRTSPGGVPLLADVDGDGRTDAAVFDPTHGGWRVARSDGARFLPAVPWDQGTGPKGVPLLGDVDGDGKADAVIYDPVARAFWTGRSDGTRFGTAQHWIGPEGLSGAVDRARVALADADGDKKADAIIFDAEDRQVWVSEATGSGSPRWTRWGAFDVPPAFPFLDLARVPRDTVVMQGPSLRQEMVDQVHVAAELSSTVTGVLHYTSGRWSAPDGALLYRLSGDWPRIHLFLNASSKPSRPAVVAFRVKGWGGQPGETVTIQTTVGPSSPTVRDHIVALPDSSVVIPLDLEPGLTMLIIEARRLAGLDAVTLGITDLKIQTGPTP